MPAYVLSIIKIKDTSRFRLYQRLAYPSLAAYRARPLAIIDPHQLIARTESTIAGKTWPVVYSTLIEFADLETAHRWHDSVEYAEAKELLHDVADVTVAIVEGLNGTATVAMPISAPARLAS